MQLMYNTSYIICSDVQYFENKKKDTNEKKKIIIIKKAGWLQREPLELIDYEKKN